MTLNTSSLSSAQNISPLTQPKQPNEFKALQQALQSGDLAGAQKAYAALSAKFQQQSQTSSSTTGTSGTSSTSNPFQTALANIGKALQSGDLSAPRLPSRS